jgi:hypothetical protein
MQPHKTPSLRHKGVNPRRLAGLFGWRRVRF